MGTGVAHSPLNFQLSYLRILLRWVLFFIAIGAVLYSFVGVNSSPIRTLWVLDTSLSLVTQDIGSHDNVVISRFDAARALILSGTKEETGYHALLTFDDLARLQIPFSTDIATFHAVIESIEPVLYGGSTDITTTLSSIKLIYPYGDFHIVILTDGENSGSGGVLPELPTNITLSIIGIGTPAGGPMLQGYDTTGRPRYKQYQGENAISRLDEAYLSQIAERYQGDLYKVANIRDIENVLREMPKNKGTTLPDASKWFLFGGIILFLVALFQKPYKMVEM